LESDGVVVGGAGCLFQVGNFSPPQRAGTSSSVALADRPFYGLL
jgi:hypothetical protein